MSNKSEDWKTIAEVESTRTPDLVLPYATFGDQKLIADVYLPPPNEGPDGLAPRPALVFFHGGGLFVGTSKTYLPNWLIYEAHLRGWIFLSVDHRLLIPLTGHAMVQDVKSLFSFISSSLNSHLAPNGIQIDPSRVIVAGASAGGYMARLAALHAEPKPRAILSNYGMGGKYLGTAYTSGRDKPFHLDRPLVDPSAYEDFTDPDKSKGKEEVSSVPMETVPNLETDFGRRHSLLGLCIQIGTYSDLLTGIKGFSSRLVENGFDTLTVPDDAKPLFPELFHSSFPPTYLIHGAQDTLVFPEESIHTYEALKKLGIDTELVIAEGANHNFDLRDEATMEEYHGAAVRWLEKYVKDPAA